MVNEIRQRDLQFSPSSTAPRPPSDTGDIARVAIRGSRPRCRHSGQHHFLHIQDSDREQVSRIRVLMGGVAVHLLQLAGPMSGRWTTMRTSTSKKRRS